MLNFAQYDVTPVALEKNIKLSERKDLCQLKQN